MELQTTRAGLELFACEGVNEAAATDWGKVLSQRIVNPNQMMDSTSARDTSKSSVNKLERAACPNVRDELGEGSKLLEFLRP